MNDQADPLEADRGFFAALQAGGIEELSELLASDFVLIDVMNGAEISRDTFLEALSGGELKFDSIVPSDVRVRRYGLATVVTGRTEMEGHYGESAFAISSRYTHVYILHENGWELVSAQGTPIAGG